MVILRRLFLSYRTNHSAMTIIDENRNTDSVLVLSAGMTFPDFPLTRPLRTENITSAFIPSY